MKLNPKLKDFWLSPKKIKALYGGRASSKTEDTAGFLIFLAYKYKIKVACVRKFQANIRQSVYSVLRKKIESDDFFKDKFKFTETNIISITTGSEFIFLGWERNTDQIKGLDNIDAMWLEEGHTLTEEQFNIIKPTVLLRKETAMLIIVFNPFLDSDYAYREFVLKEHPDVIKRHINYYDNPFLPKSALEFIEKEKQIMDYDEFSNVYLGYPKSENEESFIKRAWFEACINANEVLGITTRGSYKIGYDIADSGNDKSANVVVHGNEAIEIIEWKSKEHELELSAEKTLNRALEYNANIIYDCIGVGASAGAVFKRLGYNNFSKFDAGAGVKSPDKAYMPRRKNKDHFENLKAQSWQKVADMLLHTYKAVALKEPFDEDMILSINPKCDKIEQLKIELSSPMKQLSIRGLVKVESKKDLAKRGIPSPNIADAFIMAFAEVSNFGRFK